jgi:hypothetical protein
MPLTTPIEAVQDYGGDSDHFMHVLDHLFAPAVEKSGHDIVKPIVSGADLIQAEIIRNLETASLVLCDISRHNPNVFFELGVRTSLDRPVALVRDSLTDRLPFDTGILNTYTYDATLAPWKLRAEIDALAEHLSNSVKRSEGGNPLWKYFGLTQRARPESTGGDPTQDKLDLLLTTVATLQPGPLAVTSTGVPSQSSISAARELTQLLEAEGVAVQAFELRSNGEVAVTLDEISEGRLRELEDFVRARRLGLTLTTPNGMVVYRAKFA